MLRHLECLYFACLHFFFFCSPASPHNMSQLEYFHFSMAPLPNLEMSAQNWWYAPGPTHLQPCSSSSSVSQLKVRSFWSISDLLNKTSTYCSHSSSCHIQTRLVKVRYILLHSKQMFSSINLNAMLLLRSEYCRLDALNLCVHWTVSYHQRQELHWKFI